MYVFHRFSFIHSSLEAHAATAPNSFVWWLSLRGISDQRMRISQRMVSCQQRMLLRATLGKSRLKRILLHLQKERFSHDSVSSSQHLSQIFNYLFHLISITKKHFILHSAKFHDPARSAWDFLLWLVHIFARLGASINLILKIKHFTILFAKEIKKIN